MNRTFLFVGLLAILGFSADSQERLRTIDWLPNENRMGNAIADENGRFKPSEIKALSIVSISVEGRPITPGRSFGAGESWLKTLTVRLKNTSDQPIKSIRFHFLLPEAKNGEKISGFSLEYGKELSTGIGYGEQKLVAPGDEVDIVRNEKHYERDSTAIAMRTGVSDFSQIIIGTAQVILADGTSWISWKLPLER